MTVNETFVLMLALIADGRLRYRDVTQAMPRGYEPWRILDSLKNDGALEHLGYDHWQITEKGRIAIALAMHKDPALAYAFDTEKSRPANRAAGCRR